MILDNGTFDKASPLYHQTVLPYSPKYAGDALLKGIVYILHGSKWVSLDPVQQYTGTLSPAETIDILKHLKSIHNDDIRVQKGSQAGIELIPFDEAIKILGALQKNWKPIELP